MFDVIVSDLSFTKFYNIHLAPPSKSPLVETQVSKLSNEEICNYFASKGNPVSSVVRDTPEFFDMFIKNVKVDYRCMESYPRTNTKLRTTPLFIIGGELDPGISILDLKGWEKHAVGYKGNDVERKPTRLRRSTTETLQALTASFTSAFRRSAVYDDDDDLGNNNLSQKDEDIDIDATLKQHNITKKENNDESANKVKPRQRRVTTDRTRFASSLTSSLIRSKKDEESPINVNSRLRRRRVTRSDLSSSLTSSLVYHREEDIQESIPNTQPTRRRRTTTMDSLMSSLTRSSLPQECTNNADEEETTELINGNVSIKIYNDQGHFYLNEEHILADLGDYIVSTVTTLAKSNEDLAKEEEIRKHVETAFQRALGLSW